MKSKIFSLLWLISVYPMVGLLYLNRFFYWFSMSVTLPSCGKTKEWRKTELVDSSCTRCLVIINDCNEWSLLDGRSFNRWEVQMNQFWITLKHKNRMEWEILMVCGTMQMPSDSWLFHFLSIPFRAFWWWWCKCLSQQFLFHSSSTSIGWSDRSETVEDRFRYGSFENHDDTTFSWSNTVSHGCSIRHYWSKKIVDVESNRWFWSIHRHE